MSAPCPVYGFELRFRVDPALSEAAIGALWSQFVTEVERRGLLAGGGGDDEWSHVILGDGVQATEADREAMLAWAQAHPHLRDAAVGPLVDINESAE